MFRWECTDLRISQTGVTSCLFVAENDRAGDNGRFFVRGTAITNAMCRSPFSTGIVSIYVTTLGHKPWVGFVRRPTFIFHSKHLITGGTVRLVSQRKSTPSAC